MSDAPDVIWIHDGRIVGIGPALCREHSNVKYLRATPERESLERVNAELVEACEKTLAFFESLASGLEIDDPLRDIRERFHAPIKAILRAALTAARRDPSPERPG